MRRRKIIGRRNILSLQGKDVTEREKEENIIEKEKLTRVERQHGTEIEGSTRGPHGPKTC